jgi:serine/threonine protein kinase
LLYAAPEIIQELPYSGLKADLWSVGVALYTTLTGCFRRVTESLPDERLVGETAR